MDLKETEREKNHRMREDYCFKLIFRFSDDTNKQRPLAIKMSKKTLVSPVKLISTSLTVQHVAFHT